MKRFSLFLSYAFCVVGFLVVLGMCVAFPIVGIRFLATVPGAERFAFVIYLLTYLIFALVLIADVCLICLLNGIYKKQSAKNKLKKRAHTTEHIGLVVAGGERNGERVQRYKLKS